MPLASRVEDLDAWRRSRELANLVYDYSRDEAFGRDLVMRDQVRRSAIAALAAISSGFDREARHEFAQHLAAARGAIAEVEATMHIASDQGYISGRQLTALLAVADTARAAIATLGRSLRGSEGPGNPRPSGPPPQGGRAGPGDPRRGPGGSRR